MSDVERMIEHKSAAQRAREIVAGLYPPVSPTYDPVYQQSPMSLDDLQAAITAAITAAEREAIERCAEVAEEYAEENRRMASDTILLDPFLSGKSRSLDAVVKSQELQIDGCIHSAMFHAASNIAAACRALVKETE